MNLKVKEYWTTNGSVFCKTEDGSIYQLDGIYPINIHYGELDSNSSELITLSYSSHLWKPQSSDPS